MPTTTPLASALGWVVGWLGAPLFGLISFARQARTFHPRGLVYRASAAPSAAVPPELEALAARLAGPALVRFSGALWKREIPFDVLGCALRLQRSGLDTPEPAEDDQDLLFATIRRPWTMPLSPFTTDARDFLANDYFAVSPFDAGLRRPIYLRLQPTLRAIRAAGAGRSRADRLAAHMAARRAELRIDAGPGPFGPWLPLLAVSLERAAVLDDEALRFHPFRAGRGVLPIGFVHGLRRGAYALSQWARPRTTRPRAPREPPRDPRSPGSTRGSSNAPGAA